MKSSATDVSVLVIGYGNPLRGDDGAGWAAADMLADRTQAITTHQLVPELAEPISKAGLVVFIDAAADLPPGKISRRPVQPLEQTYSMTHHFSPAGLLSLARQVYGRCPQALLFTIGGEDFSHRQELSRTVQAACRRVVRQVRRTCMNYRSHPRSSS